MTNFSGENLNAACGGPQGGGMDSRRNGVAEVSPKYLADIATNGVPVGYKQTAVGLIPEDWLTLTLGDIADLTSSKRIFESDYVKSGVPFYRGQEISSLLNGSVIENVIYISQAKFNELAARFGAPKAGEILITAVGTLGNSFLIESNDPFYFKDGNLIWLRKIKNCQPKYLIKQLNYNKNRVLECAIGSSQKALTMVSLSPLLIPVPSKIEEQTAIANALSDVDALISELEKLIAKKQAIKTATMQQLLTGRTRLPPFAFKESALREDGTPTNSSGTNLHAGAGGPKGEGQDGLRKGTKPSELGEIPEDWEVVTLEQSVNCLDNLRIPLNEQQRSKMRGDIPYCGANGIVGWVNEYVLDDDVILMAEDGGYFDEFSTRPIAYRMIGKCWVNNHAHILQAKESFDQGYIFYCLVHKDIQKYLASGTRAKLNKSEMERIEIIVPSAKGEQTAIATILSDIDEELQALEQRLGKTRQIKQGMMQELLTGRIRLIKPSKEVIHE